ncbi:histidine kinase N-terminal 7TM domain-containing diguanylate cyclase [Cohnella fermenti]|uniref:Diguanylate cyclase n=1 Tax=Cohnella fermenti TaxID=2565925 RepID=A0A4S4C3B8_9BACL|nr:histidine kinase N-terminal 7TM domain-containing protein [Cohnella fermenti]THF82228.1 diguanylate cyclase [Cohnella fermenti]
MNSQLTAFVTLISTSGVFNLYLCIYVLNRRHLYPNIAKYFVLYTAATAVYCFGSAFGLMATSLEQMKLWTIVLYMGMPFSPPLGLLFNCRYLGIKVTKRRVAALLTIPSITLAMVATNDWHHLHYRVFEVDPVLGAPYVHLEIGAWYAVHGIFIFGCMFASFLLLLSRWKETAQSYRLQLVALMCGQLVPIVTAFAYLIGVTPPGIDPVPVVLWLSSILYVVSINSSRMFSIVPIAKDAIFNSMDNGVVVTDETNRLIEFNRQAESMFPRLDKSMFGMSIEQAWLELAGAPLPAEWETTAFVCEYPFASDPAKRIYQVRATSLRHANNRRGQLIIIADVTELKRLQDQLEHQAYYDELTRIYNRRAFFQKGEQALVAAKEASLPFALILFDIDHFKRVNDTYGHQTGDRLLKHVADVCSAELAEGMLFARYGGEEFAVALGGSTAEEGEALANRLRRRVEEQPLPLHTGERSIAVTVSVGVTEAAVGAGESLYQLLSEADQALYAAKGGGRNQVRVYSGK